MQVSLTPQDAVLYLYDATTGRRVLPQDGVYSLNEGASYCYTLTCKGYRRPERRTHRRGDCACSRLS